MWENRMVTIPMLRLRVSMLLIWASSIEILSFDAVNNNHTNGVFHPGKEVKWLSIELLNFDNGHIIFLALII